MSDLQSISLFCNESKNKPFNIPKLISLLDKCSKPVQKAFIYYSKISVSEMKGRYDLAKLILNHFKIKSYADTYLYPLKGKIKNKQIQKLPSYVINKIMSYHGPEECFILTNNGNNCYRSLKYTNKEGTVKDCTKYCLGNKENVKKLFKHMNDSKIVLQHTSEKGEIQYIPISTNEFMLHTDDYAYKLKNSNIETFIKEYPNRIFIRGYLYVDKKFSNIVNKIAEYRINPKMLIESDIIYPTTEINFPGYKDKLSIYSINGKMNERLMGPNNKWIVDTVMNYASKTNRFTITLLK